MNWLKKFMLGRYGMDQLSSTMIFGGLALAILSRVLKVNILNSIALVTILFAYYRTFSRQVNKRYKENMKFLQLVGPLRGKLKGLTRRFRDRKDYKYFKCASCGQLVRVPKGKGKLVITCPKCKMKFSRRT